MVTDGKRASVTSSKAAENERDVALANGDDDEGSASESNFASKQVMSLNRDIAEDFIIDANTASSSEVFKLSGFKV